MTLHTAVPVRANGVTGSVRVLGMQTSADVTKRPDAVKASGAQSEGARMRGAFSAAQLYRAASQKQDVMGLVWQAV
jgi:hypothetical protein